MANLWSRNTPAQFWCLRSEISDGQWQTAIEKAIPILEISNQPNSVDTLLETILGEGQFGPDRWRYSRSKYLYYLIKPVLPRTVLSLFRQWLGHHRLSKFPLGWPIEMRYAQFQWEVLRQLLLLTGEQSFPFVHFWPEGQQFAFVLTHDIETAEGQAYAPKLAELDASFGFRSSFNFVPERYKLDYGLMEELRCRGFEIGVHGLRHDGKLFKSETEFMKRAERINQYLEDWNADGFRAPFTHRQPEWMQTLNIEYDLSFFDTDPYEPCPGGTMTIWPYFIGHFVELPYTLMQDATLFNVLKQTTPQLWLQKVDFIQRYNGMALLNTHPDYLQNETAWKVYTTLLQDVSEKGGYWHALPREVAQWWNLRTSKPVWSKKVIQNGMVVGAT